MPSAAGSKGGMPHGMEEELRYLRKIERYGLRDLTPEGMDCIAAACPRIYSDDKCNDYLIIGTQINPS